MQLSTTVYDKLGSAPAITTKKLSVVKNIQTCRDSVYVMLTVMKCAMKSTENNVM